MPTGNIELNRRFVDLSDGPTGLHVETYLQVVQNLSRTIGWDELLKSSCVVVLGEAGTGKTTEFKTQPALLRVNGDSAFFMDITDLARDGAELAVPAVDVPLLHIWRGGSCPAVFFLDSVDEAELRQQSLGRALRKLAAFLGPARSRARVVVSCRVSDWSTASGRAALEDFVRASGGDPNDLRIVQMMPLDDVQVERLARHFGASDSGGLLEAVRQASAQPFAARPLDVEWLVGYWAEHREIGTLTDLVERSVAKRLEERRPNSCPRSPLSKTKGRQGLMRLAGLAVLCGRWSLLVPGEAADGPADLDTIDPREALGDWNDDEIRELLTRAVFDESTYGRVRFHHRSVQEYLAARWLLDKVNHGMRRRELHRLLFHEAGGIPFVPAHLAPSAAWLALWARPVLDRLIEVDSAILFEHGDPSGLAASDRKRVLSAYLSSYSGRERLFSRFDEAGLRRFAPALDSAVKSQLGRIDLPQEAVAFLLQVAGLGQFRSCAAEALAWAQDLSAESQLRCQALETVNLVVDDATKHRLVDNLVAQTPAWSQGVAGVFAAEFYPEFVTPTQLGELLRNTLPGHPSHFTAVKTFVRSRLPEACPEEQRLGILAELLGCERVATRDKGWLMHGILGVTRMAIMSMPENGEPAEELVRALLLLRSDEDRHIEQHELQGIRDSVAAKPGLRRWLYWRRVEEAKERFGTWPLYYHQVYHPRPLSHIGPPDVAWLAEDARTLPELGARKIAFGNLLAMNGHHSGLAETVAALIAENTQFAEMSREADESNKVPRQPWEERLLREQEELELERAVQHAQNLDVLNQHIEEIRSGKHRNLLWWLYRQAQTTNSHFGELSVDKVKNQYGEELGHALSSGLKVCWRGYRPPFAFEQEDRNSIPREVCIGLAGLGLLFEAGLEPNALSDPEVESAVRYAVREMNGFPPWFSSLAEAHPETVVSTLRPVAAADLALDQAGENSEFLQRHRGVPAAIRGALAEAILEILEKEEPRDRHALENALHICEWLPRSRTQDFVDLCAERLEWADTVERGVIWWRALAHLDPQGAVAYLEGFADLANPDDRDDVMEETCAALGHFGERESSQSSTLMQDAIALERLIPLVYSTVRPENDRALSTSRMAEALTARDRAQEFRGTLFRALVAIGTPFAIAALQRLANDPRMTGYRDVLLMHAGQVPQRSAQAQPMSPKQAFAWSRNNAMPVRTAQDLHRVALDCLDDIREHVQEGESSTRDLFLSADEKKFQPWFMAELEARNRHHYTVHREEEADRKKMPDIRLAHSSCSEHPVSIEIKVAENWTGAELREALVDQLVGRYLRAAKSRHGILLLCSRGKQKKWKFGSKLCNLDEARGFLQAEADALVSRSTDIDGLDVVTVDFH